MNYNSEKLPQFVLLCARKSEYWISSDMGTVIGCRLCSMWLMLERREIAVRKWKGDANFDIPFRVIVIWVWSGGLATRRFRSFDG